MAPRSGVIARSAGPRYSARLLVIDEDEKRALKMKAGLEQQGFAVRCAGDGPAGFALMAQQMPDLLLVDAILPGMPAIDVCRHLRRVGSDVPIIVLSPRSDEIDVVVTMEMGADDFIAEPYGMRELVARVRAVLRRSNRSAISHSTPPPGERYSSGGRQSARSAATGAQNDPSPQAQPARITGARVGSSRNGMPDQGGNARPDILKVGDLSLDRARHEVLLEGKPIEVPRREFILLEALMEKPGRLLTRQVLIERIWGPGWGSRRILSTLVNRLRALIESNADHPTRIVTIRGIGYRYEVPNEGGAARPRVIEHTYVSSPVSGQG
ncbi:MAG: response regulator transcription factor [Acidimicrobiales bacterium]|jgi:two-component system response regulator RegX3